MLGCTGMRQLGGLGAGSCRRIQWSKSILRPRHAPQHLQVRPVTVAGLKQYKSGHIDTVSNEGILFFDNVFPLHLQWLLRLPWRAETVTPELIKRFQRPTLANVEPVAEVERASPDTDLPFEITEVLPRFSEGGAFVKFRHDDDVSADSVETSLRAHLKQKRIRPWWNPFSRAHARLVRGRPWIEDLHRLPSARLKVEFLPAQPGAEAAELSQEQLYGFFRPYGKLADIAAQPPDSKVVPKFATLDFASMRRAIMAKNCLHGFRVPPSEGGGKDGTVLRLTYVPKVRFRWIKDWLFSHPRLVIPVLAAIIATITVAVFDPIRTWFIKAHITRTFHVQDSKAWRWFKSQATDLLRMPHRDDDDAMEAIWDDRKENIEQLRTWLMETADTFIVVQGPRGSEKRKLVVEQALRGRRNKLVIDCKPIQDARGDSATIRAAAMEVGYRPVFSWMNSMSSFVDLAAQGATGVKTGFSETLDGQLSKIFNNTAAALKQVALEDRHKTDKDAHLTDDEYLDAHPEKRPVVVVDNFLHKSQETDLVYEKMAEWASRLTTANLAHVIFLTSEVSYTKTLSKALPDRVFRTLSLTDCSPAVAKRYVLDQLNADADDPKPSRSNRSASPPPHRPDLTDLDASIAALGGRLTDLEFLARRIKAGETPTKAVSEIIAQSASEVLKMYLSPPEGAAAERPWTPEQAWALVKRLAACDATTSSSTHAAAVEGHGLRYNEVLLDPAFPSDAAAGDAILRALESAELISVVSAHGRPRAIRPGKPVLQQAFKLLVRDRVLRSRMELASLGRRIKAESEDIKKFEDELGMLAALPKQPAEVGGRVKWVLGKIREGQEKVEGWEREKDGWKKVLREEF